MSLLSCACGNKETKKRRAKNISTASIGSKDGSPKTAQTEQQPQEGEEEVEEDMEQIDAAQVQPDPLQYELYAVIGKGHSNISTITLAKNTATDSLVAVKRVNLELWPGELRYLQNEMAFTQMLSHRNVLPFYCSFISGQELWAVMPLMAFGSCRDLIHAYFTSGLPELAIKLIMRDVIAAVDYLHYRWVIHRGIKASHVLISKSGRVCLSGLHNAFYTIQNGQRLRTVHDFPLHAADCVHSYSPELLEQNLAGYSFNSDVYSLGILLCELANGQAPFADLPATAMLLEKMKGTKPHLADSTTVSEFVIDEDAEYPPAEGMEDQPTSSQERADAIFFKRTFAPQLHDLAAACLERDPHHRPTAGQLLHHPVFKSIKNCASSVLPSQLQPVTPLTDQSNIPKDLTMDDDDFSRKMSEVSMLEDWVF
ncbi:ste20-related kinase adapter protein alpha [Plakobranchus ocellatus]|uniref:Ste20-related kinase adapter protein alpha n=1 Tax=Plakobranchus ocellatus TaxID=259542 RepID=A0AAV4D6E6_9GAST|nr:ste20-related kinase adapter protein alpha [Plakobranchus ocellatus]